MIIDIDCKHFMRCVFLGTVILDSQQRTIEGVVDDILEDLISRRHLKKENREAVAHIILSQHHNKCAISRHFAKKNTIADLLSLNTNKKHSSSTHSLPGDNKSSLMQSVLPSTATSTADLQAITLESEILREKASLHIYLSFIHNFVKKTQLSIYFIV